MKYEANPLRRALLIVIGSLMAVGCAGFRGGWESVPYIGESAPALAASRTPYEAQQRSVLSADGLRLGVRINNQLQTYDTQVYLFVLPLGGDLRNVYTQSVEPGRTRVILQVSPSVPDFVFRPRAASLSVAGVQVSGIAGYEFMYRAPQEPGATSGASWSSSPIGDELKLSDVGHTYVVCIDFPIDTPSPQSPEIRLDLSQALVAEGRGPLPLIRFAPTRWREGYS